MPTIDNMSPAMAEVMRRQMGQQPSGVGIPGQSGASESSQANPIQQAGLNTSQPMPASGQSPMGGDSTAGAREMLQNALPGEATMIIKQLSKTLDRLTPNNNGA